MKELFFILVIFLTGCSENSNLPARKDNDNEDLIQSIKILSQIDQDIRKEVGENYSVNYTGELARKEPHQGLVAATNNLRWQISQNGEDNLGVLIATVSLIRIGNAKEYEVKIDKNTLHLWIEIYRDEFLFHPGGWIEITHSQIEMSN